MTALHLDDMPPLALLPAAAAPASTSHEGSTPALLYLPHPMAHPHDDPDRAESQASTLLALVEAAGVALRRRGRTRVGACPFCTAEAPALVISTDGTWQCTATCATAGGPVEWVMRAQGVSRRHAERLVRAGDPSVGALADGRQSRFAGAVPKRTTRVLLAADLDPDGTDQEIIRWVADCYARALPDSSDGQAYLEQRGLRDEALIRHFHLGLSDRTLGYHLPKANRPSGAKIRGRLQQLGIYRQSGHEHLCGSLVVPISDEVGNIVEIYGRKIGSGLRRGTPLHLYLGDGPPTALFHVEGLRDATQVILTASALDAMTFWRWGFREVVATFGAGVLGAEHASLLREHGIERVFVAYRRDADGDKAARRAGKLLSAAGIEVFQVVLPRGMDVNEYARSAESPHESLLTALRCSKWLGSGEPTSAPWALFGPVDDGPAPEPVDTESTTIEAMLGAAQHQDDDGERGDEDVPAPAESGATLARRHSADGVHEPEAEPDDDRDDAPEKDGGPLAEPEATSAANGDEIVLSLGERTWRVRGLADNTSPRTMRVNLLVTGARGFHVDVVELYAARQRTTFGKEAAVELGVDLPVLKREVGKVLVHLESVQAIRLAEAAKPKTTAPEMTEGDRDEALALLRDPALLDRVVDDLDRCGVVGERTNKLVGYLAVTSRLDARPIGVVIRSTTAGGKTTVADAVLGLVPPEQRVHFSAMTGQALFYVGADALSHKVLSIAEEQGARRASYALKLLQSEGKLTIASTTKDAAGRLATETYDVEGPVQLLLTTTAIDIDEELANRCITLTVDEGRDQTRAIHARQRQAETLDGMIAKVERERTVRRHQNAQRLLQPLAVANPYALELRFVDHATRTRRDHGKYLALIRAVALLHQHQREIHETQVGGRTLRYVEVIPRDVEIANKLCDEVLGQSLDVLQPQTRKLLTLAAEMVEAACAAEGIEQADYRFTRRALRDHTCWGYTQLRIHLQRLVEMEYVLAHRGSRGQQYVYELCWDGRGEDGSPHLTGLIDPSVLSGTRTTTTSRG